MREFFRSCVDLYADPTGTDKSTYPAVPTLFGDEATDLEDGLGGPEGRDCAPAMQALAEFLALPCPIDPHTQQDPTGIGCVLPPIDPAAPTLLARSDQGENNTDNEEVPDSGLLRPVAAKILMKILYGARMARYDLLKAVCHSASCITKWTRQNDVDVYRLICYIQTTIEYCQHSFCGNSAQELQLAVYADADWAGDKY